MGHYDRSASGMQVIAKSDAHVGLLISILADSYSRGKSDIGKMPIPVVLVEIISAGIIGLKKVKMSITVEVGPNHRQSKRSGRIGNSSLLGYIRECAVAVVVVKIGRRALQSSRTALDGDSAKLASRARTERRKIVQIQIHIVRHKQVRPAIAIVVAEGRSRCPSGIIAQACLFSDVSECSIAIIAIQHYPAEAGHQQIGPAIVVVVSDDGAHCPTRIADTGLIRHVGESSVVIVVIKRASRLLPGKRHLYALGVGEVDIGPSVAVIIDESNASAHRLHNIFLLWTRKMIELDAGRIGDVD